MSTNKLSWEQISALADNELSDRHVDVAIAALRHPEEQAAWDIYHRIGDVLRSEEMAIAMRPDFMARMTARLDAEPVIIAPAFSRVASAPQPAAANGKAKFSRFKRFAVPGMVAAAAASVALITAPQLMVATKGNATGETAQVMIGSASHPAPTHGAVVSASAPQATLVSTSTSDGAVVLRDPHIDEYLRAHQRFSPSVYSSAQFARSATLARDSEK
jgi:sigma-E factor negative regulatory protein RseA